MCLLVMFYRMVDDAPLVIGANREESYQRGGEPPQLLPGNGRAVGGRDPVAGGTWLGVNEHGVLIAVTNRPRTEERPSPRSRGLLVCDLLERRSAAEAVDHAVRELGSQRYAGCNLLCADSRTLTVIHASDWLRVRPLPPGLHVMTTHDVNDASDRRLGHAQWWLLQRGYADAADAVSALQELCGQRGNPDPPICLRGEHGGTVSSTIVVLRNPLAHSLMFHAQGPPDSTPYRDYSHLFQQLAPQP